MGQDPSGARQMRARQERGASVFRAVGAVGVG